MQTPPCLHYITLHHTKSYRIILHHTITCNIHANTITPIITMKHAISIVMTHVFYMFHHTKSLRATLLSFRPNGDNFRKINLWKCRDRPTKKLALNASHVFKYWCASFLFMLIKFSITAILMKQDYTDKPLVTMLNVIQKLYFAIWKFENTRTFYKTLIRALYTV